MISSLTWNEETEEIEKERKEGNRAKYKGGQGSRGVLLLTVQVDQRVHCFVTVAGGCQRLTVLILVH